MHQMLIDDALSILTNSFYPLNETAIKFHHGLRSKSSVSGGQAASLWVYDTGCLLPASPRASSLGATLPFDKLNRVSVLLAGNLDQQFVVRILSD